MTLDEVFAVITKNAQEVLPQLSTHRFEFDDSLGQLGANSIDRSEIVMMTLESLSLRIPLIEVAGASNMGELASILHEKL